MSAQNLRVEVPGGPEGGITRDDVRIKALGACQYASPVSTHLGESALAFVGAADKVLVNDRLSQLPKDVSALSALPAFETAGPAAQDLLARDGKTDKSGNAKLEDVGPFLRDQINHHFSQNKRDTTLKYIDPSYTIRSDPASPSDSVYCWNMARNAVHAAMAGNTEMLIGRWHGRFVHVPMALSTVARKQVDLNEDLWMSVIEATGQPRSFE